MDQKIGVLLSVSTGLIFSLIYFVGFEQSRYQGTPGKVLMRLQVGDLNGHRLSFKQALIRYICYYVPVLALWWIILPALTLPLQITTDLCNMINNTPELKSVKYLCDDESFSLNAAIGLFTLLRPVFVFSLIGLWIVLTLIWFVPILLRSRTGMHDRISNTAVFNSGKFAWKWLN
jgi:uncharacterized RDD family membrane protein YckC